MFCPKCGKNLPDHAQFCSGCGASLGGRATTSGSVVVDGTSEKNAGRFGAKVWKLWTPLLAVLLAVAVVLVSVFAERTVKAPDGDAIRMKGKQIVVSEMTGYNIIEERYRWRVNYDIKNKRIDIDKKQIETGFEGGGVYPYDYELGIANLFAPMISPTRHPEEYLPVQDGAFPTDITFAFCDLIRSGAFETIQSETDLYRFFTNEKHQLVKYTLHEEGDDDLITAYYQYDSQGRLERITRKEERSLTSTEYLVEYSIEYQNGSIEVERCESYDGEIDNRTRWRTSLNGDGSFENVTYLYKDYTLPELGNGQETPCDFQGDRLTKVGGFSYRYNEKGLLMSIQVDQGSEDAERVNVDTRYQYTTINL